MNKPGIRIADVTWDDLPTVADIHVRVWKQAYKGLINDDYLNNLTVEYRLKKWREGFTKRAGLPMTGVNLIYVDDIAMGFSGYGPGRDDDRKDWAEIYAVYVLQEGWRHGLGYRLFDSTRTIFKEHGKERAFLWVLDTNERALAAYRQWGGTLEPDRRKQDSIGTQTVNEISVRFSL